MNLVLISDTHCHHGEFELPEGDILVGAGDYCSHGNLGEMEDFNEWLAELDFEHIVIIAGNHDWPLAHHDRKVKGSKFPLSLFPDNVHYLQDSGVKIGGVKFWGSPWQPQYYNWAFNLPRGPRLRQKWDQIPDDIDVLITHGPPLEIQDRNMQGENVGCKDLLERVLQVRPKYHVFGHIHAAYGMNYWLLEGTTFVNASVCDEGYLPTNRPVEVGI